MMYLYVCILSVLFAHLAARTKDKTLIYIYSAISILIPSIVGGLRAYGVGTDTMVYARPDFLSALQSPDMETFVFSGREIGYRFICYTVANAFRHENWCYFAYQIISLTCVYIGAYKHKDKLSLPFFMFVWFAMYYTPSYNAIRQTLACAIIFMNIDQLEKKKYWSFALTIVFAALFHTSALATFALLIGLHIVTTSKTLDNNLWMKIIVLYGSLAMFLVLRPIMAVMVNSFSVFAKYVGYVNLNRSGGTLFAGYNSVLVLFIGETIMFLLYGKRGSYLFFNNGIKNFEFYKYNMMFCVVFIAVVHIIAYRILMYQYYVNLLALSALPRFVKEKHLRFLVMMIIVAVLSYYWWHIHVVRGNSAVWPYRSIL